jgi:hypothetical protein
MVMDRVLQDPMEDQRQLRGRSIRIFLRQLEHRILDDVERRVLVADSVHRLLERAALDLGEERRKLWKGSQREFEGVLGAAGL